MLGVRGYILYVWLFDLRIGINLRVVVVKGWVKIHPGVFFFVAVKVEGEN